MHITWKHQHTELDANSSIEKKIELFEHRVWGWQLHIADLVINGGKHHDETGECKGIPHAGFATLQILLSYFEMFARYEQGNTKSDQTREAFINGVLSVFPEVQGFPYAATHRFLNIIYKDARCGLYHMSIPGNQVGISSGGFAIFYDDKSQQIIIDPHKLAATLKTHFKDYIARLNDPTQTELRAAFERRFNHDHYPKRQK